MKVINTDKAPAAIGPYSQAIAAGDLLFVSGQLPINPATGTIDSDVVVSQLHQSMKNIAAIAEEAGTSFANLVKTTILMQDLAGFADVNEAYGSYLSEPFPARATFQVAALPKGALIEIEAVFSLKGAL
ncbi:2-iminobutanoate/2-iminopropanoate deaminase [Cohaesibacter sp. ES.047]|nr:2-iminobutanoate/2-iminopropanoate deaminase [Cohaesibacter sp. ES.047]